MLYWLGVADNNRTFLVLAKTIVPQICLFFLKVCFSKSFSMSDWKLLSHDDSIDEDGAA
jgi:hypothetical protein